MTKDYYKILELNFNSSYFDIKKSYRKLAVFWHPDRNSNPNATNRMIEINEAYEVLSNPSKRELYNKIYNHFISNEDKNFLTFFNNQSKEDQEKIVEQKFGKDYEDLKMWIKSLKFSLKSVDNFLDKSMGFIDPLIENIAFYVPIILMIAVVVGIILANVL
jgi:curved DNA-binding protein CbpA